MPTYSQDSPADCHDESQWRHFSGYQELDQTKQEIRVLTLLDGSADSDILCTIEQGPLSSIQPFVALSYCWGPANEVNEIIIENERIHIRKNLWHFLCQLRTLKGTIRIWVDFVCINQHNAVERNHQVKLMQGVFSTATCVYAWLGVATPQSEKAVDYIEQTFGSPDKEGQPPRRPVSRSVGLCRLNAIFDRAYWTRLWIIQELVLAPDIQLMIGSRTIPWKHLTDLWKRSPQRSPRFGRTEGKSTFVSIRRLKKDTSLHNPRGTALRSLGSMLDDFHHAESKDPRDKIYGLLGMADASVREQISVEYGASWLKVCLDNLNPLVPPYETPTISSYLKVLHKMSAGREHISRELQQAAESASLRSSIPRVTISGVHMLVNEWDCYTFAARKHSDSTFEPLTQANSSKPFDVYISVTKQLTETYRHKPDGILYTSCLPKADDFFVSLEAGGNPVFIVRHGGKHFCSTDLCFWSNDLVYNMPDPLQWRNGMIPDVHLQIGTPMSDMYTSWDGQARVKLNLDVNGAAMAEMFRIRVLPCGWTHMESMLISWDPTRLIAALDMLEWQHPHPFQDWHHENVSAEGCPIASRRYHLGASKYFILIRELIIRERPSRFKSGIPHIRTGSLAEWKSAFYSSYEREQSPIVTTNRISSIATTSGSRKRKRAQLLDSD